MELGETLAGCRCYHMISLIFVQTEGGHLQKNE